MSQTKQINVGKFKEIVRKATLDYTIKTVQINVSGEKIWSGMKTETNNVIIFLNYDKNDVIYPINDEISLNFSDPSKNVRPYLDLIADDDTSIFPINISDEKIMIKSDSAKCNLHHCREDAVTTILMEKDPSSTLKPFLELPLNTEVVETFNKIKKIAQRFDKIYFTVKNNEFFVESTDKSVNMCNTINLKLCDLEMNDVTLLFDFKSFRSILSIINGNHDDFTAKFNLIKGTAGMILFENSDCSERYYMLSLIEGEK